MLKYSVCCVILKGCLLSVHVIFLIRVKLCYENIHDYLSSILRSEIDFDILLITCFFRYIFLLSEYMLSIQCQLWVGPGSRAAEEKRFFDSNLAPFYRIEQVLPCFILFPLIYHVIWFPYCFL